MTPSCLYDTTRKDWCFDVPFVFEFRPYILGKSTLRWDIRRDDKTHESSFCFGHDWACLTVACLTLMYLPCQMIDSRTMWKYQ